MDFGEYQAQMAQQDQQDQAQSPYPLILPPQSPIDDVTLVTQTNPAPLLIELAHKLKCEIEFEEDGKKVWKRMEGIEPMINDIGIHSVLVDVYGIVNQGTILSNLTIEDVENITIEIGKVVTFKLASNWKEYGIKKPNLSTIVFAITNPCYIALKRGLDQGERTFLKTAVKSTEHVMINPKGQMPGEKKFWQVWK